MAFRRVLLVGDKLPEIKTELENMFSSKLFKTNYAGVKTKIIVSPVKNDTLVVDVNGEGADTVAKKVKDIKGDMLDLSKDKEKEPTDKLQGLLLKTQMTQSAVDAKKAGVQIQQIGLKAKLKTAKKKEKALKDAEKDNPEVKPKEEPKEKPTTG